MTITLEEVNKTIRKSVNHEEVSADEMKGVLDYFHEHEASLLTQVVNPYSAVAYFARYKGRIVLVLDNTYDVDDIEKSNPELYPLHTTLTCPSCKTVGLMSVVSHDPPLGSHKLRPRRRCFACWHTTIKEFVADKPAFYGDDLPAFHYHKWTVEERNRVWGHDFED